MKIIEGTPEEIKEYLNKKPEFEVHKPIVHKNPYGPLHWSHSKQQWVKISDMDSVYITNVIRKMLREGTVPALLEDREFKALVTTLADKI